MHVALRKRDRDLRRAEQFVDPESKRALDLLTLTRSPARMGRSNSRISPLMKLLITFWLPKPTIVPPAIVKTVNGKLTTLSDMKIKAINSA